MKPVGKSEFQETKLDFEKYKNQSKVPPDLVKFPDPLFWSQAENLSTPVMGLVGDGRWHKSVAR